MIRTPLKTDESAWFWHALTSLINAVLPWVAGVSSTHGLPEAVIIIAYANQAALQCGKIFEPVRGENGCVKNR